MSPRGPACPLYVALLIAALAATGGTGMASAVPPPPNPSDEDIQGSRDDVRAAASRVGRLASQVAAASEAVTDAQISLAATYNTVTTAQRRHRAANAAAKSAERRAQQARVEVEAAERHISRIQNDVDAFVAGSYRQRSTIGSISAYAGSDNPEDLLARAQLLNAVSSAQLDALENMRRARIEKANFDAAARAALQEAVNAREAAEQTDAEARSAYAAAIAAKETAQRRTSALMTRENAVQGQLAEAQRVLASLNGQRRRYDDWRDARDKARLQREQEATHAHNAEETARPQPHRHNPVAGARVVAPTTGVVTSTYGPRWGSIHYGVDIANSIGTPVVSVMDGTVISSGPASGFGLWVRVRHDNGTITVYGHINEALVSVGQRVRTGQQIATVGNRGQSTGPHLHFEVHQGGYKIDPLFWLRRNGVSI